MLDSRFRAMLGPTLDAAGRRLAAAGVPPVALTGAGWAAGAGACAATALRAWPVALGLWLANRLADGLDGPVARASGSPSEAGGSIALTTWNGVVLAKPAARCRGPLRENVRTVPAIHANGKPRDCCSDGT